MIMNKLDELHASVNDIYEQWDDGKLEYHEAVDILQRCCLEFNSGLLQPNRLEHKIRFERAEDCYQWLDENELVAPVTLTIHLEN